MTTRIKAFINKYFRVFSYAKPYRRLFITSLILALTLSALAPLRPYWIQETIDKYITKGTLNTALNGDNPWIRGIILMTILQIALIAFETILRFIFTILSARLGQYVIKDLRAEVYQKVLKLKLGQIDQTPVGILSTRTINDIESINSIFSDGLIPMISDLLSIIVVLITMFYVHWKLTLVCLAPFPFLLIATYFFKESVKKSFQKVRQSVALLNAFVQEHLSGMSLIQTMNLTDKELAKFKTINQQHKIANIKGIMAYSIFFPVVEITAAVAISFLILSSLEIHIDAGLVIFYFLCLNQIFRPLRFIADKFNVIQMGMIASERVFALLDNPHETNIHNEGVIKPIEGVIEFQHVGFAYQEGTPILKDITFYTPAGTTTALVGPTGHGKTSIISLINQLYEHQTGQILIDNIPIKQYNLNHLRQQIGFVLQDFFLFSGSIRDNLLLNNPDIKEEDMMRASQFLGLHDMVMKLPNTYDFKIMERGSLLSVGQKQLICFTRTLLYNPKILIMDEATASIDTESEQVIQLALEKLMANRTTVVVAHRLSTIQNAHQILFIKDGTIVEKGTHRDLLQQKGHYYKLIHQ